MFDQVVHRIMARLTKSKGASGQLGTDCKSRWKQGAFWTSYHPAVRTMAVTLAICLVFTLMPSAAFATGTNGGNKLPETGTTHQETVPPPNTPVVAITAFNELDAAVQNQSVPVGTEQGALNLPATLEAVGYTAASDSGPHPEPEPVVLEGVTWTPEPAYAMDVPGQSYVFTPVLPPQYRAGEVVLPEIRVSVIESAETTGESSTTEAPLTTEVPPTTEAPPATEEPPTTESNPPEVEFSITKQPQSLTAAEGAEVIFTVKAAGEALTYQWQRGGPGPEAEDTFDRDTASEEAFVWTDIDGANGPDYAFTASLEDLFDYVYRCVVTSGGETLVTQTVTVKESVNRMLRAGSTGVPTVKGNEIYANGVAIKIVEGMTPGYTNILYDKDGSNSIEDNEYLKIGNEEPSDGGYDLSKYAIYGGRNGADVTGDTNITMTGGAVSQIYGGCYKSFDSATVSGNTNITVSGGKVNSLYGGGQGSGSGSDITSYVTGTAYVNISGDVQIARALFGGGNSGSETGNTSVTISGGKINYVSGGGWGTGKVNNAIFVKMTGGEINDIRGNESSGKVSTTSVAVSLTGGKVDGSVNLDIDIGQKIPASLTVGGSMVIGDGSSSGIQISNVKSFAIDSDLTGADGCISVVLPAGYDVSQNPVIATEAAAGDLAKIKLVGDGAANMKAYLDGTDIKVYRITPTVSVRAIYANGVAIKIVAGTTPGYTNILYDKDGNNVIGDTEYLKIGTEEPSVGGYDLSGYIIFGGSDGADVAGNTNITMTGGAVSSIYGGCDKAFGSATVSGNTNITVSGGKVHSLYGGGCGSGSGGNITSYVTGTAYVNISGGAQIESLYGGGTPGSEAGNTSVTISDGKINFVSGGGWSSGKVNNAISVKMTGGEVNDIRGNESSGKVSTTSVAVSLTGGKVDGSVNLDIDIGQKIPAALTVGGSMVIGDGSSSGIQISNVKSFVIDPDLTGLNGCISVVLPAGYDVSQNPVIATEAAAGDLAKIKLVGDGAKGVEAYFEGNAVKVKALPTPTVDQQYKQIFANGVPLLLAAGSTDTNKTVIYMDRNGNGQLDNGTDEILDPDGNGTAYDGTTSGNDLSKWIIYGGGLNVDLTGDTKVFMLGGQVGTIYGGGLGNSVTGNANISVSGGQVGSIYGGGYSCEVTGNTNITVSGNAMINFVNGGGNQITGSSDVTVTGNASIIVNGGTLNNSICGGSSRVGGNTAITVSKGTVKGKLYDSASVTVGGEATVGNGNSGGIIINGGSPTEVKNGVSSFDIDSDLTGADGCIHAVLPEGFDVTGNPIIATGAVADDLAKLRLTGDGAAGKEACFENNAIRVRKIRSADATLSALSYSVDGRTPTAVPNFAAGTTTYDVILPYDTSATASITLTGTQNDSNAAITENNGVTLSGGSGTATIKVRAENGSERTYTVNFTTALDTRSDARQITAFTIRGQVGGTSIDETQHTITVTMPYGTNVTSLAPDITVSNKATVSPQSGTAQNFTSLFTYTVTAENGRTQDYDVTVKVQEPTYGIALDQNGTCTFADAIVGYREQTPLTVTVTNTGNQPTGPLNVELTGEGRDAFILSLAGTIDSIAPGGTGTFTVQPVTGLSVGIYTASVQVSGSSINTAGFDVSFTVTTDPDDAAAVTAAKNAIEGRTYTAAQADAGDADALKAALAEQINSLPGVSSTGIILKASDITISSFIAAVAGDADAPAGTNGSFNFTVALSKGSATGTAGKDGGTITAAAYTDPNDTNRDGYHDGDVAVINAMIRNNGLSATENAPAGWGFVQWNSAAPRRIVGLEMNAKRLTGTLDLTGLTELTDVDCSENLLTDINGLPALTKLEQLDCADTDIRRLDVSGNPALIHLDCHSCPLTCLNVGENTGLDLQKSDTAMDLQVTEDTFKITDKIAGIDPSKVEVLSGADYDKTTGTVSNYRSGIPIVYTYDAGTTKDGKSQLKVTLAVTVSRLQNAWTTEPSIEDWTYGESAKTAVGSAKYGTVAFTWSYSENGPFKAEVPATAGTWYMKAGVPAGDEYTGLNKVVIFTIHKAENTSTAPISIKGWTFGDAPQTASAGFKFGTPRYVYSNQPNGTFTETVPTAAGTWYVKAIVDETADYAGAESEAAAFVIAPKKAGADSSISVPDINSSTNLDKLVIKDGDKVLVKGTDYDVTKKQDGNKVTVTVTFKGNYTGSVTKTYTVTAQNPSDKTENGSVKTGDNSMIGLFAVLSILSLGVIIVLIIIKRRNNALKKQR